MTGSTRITFDLVGIASLLKDRTLGVPIYQRSYSWERAQIDDYWSDLQSAFAKSEPEYFLGTVVLTSENTSDRIAIIDGQQRLATTAILISAIRDEYVERADDRSNIIQASYLADRDLGTGELSPHLTLNSDDDSYFRQVVIAGDDPATIDRTKISHERLAQARSRLREHVQLTANDAGTEWASKLHAWVNFLKDQVRVIAVDVPTEADAFLIFETLNDRGADLTIADLLKNYLFGKAGARLDAVRDGWMQALGALDLNVEASTFTVFLRHYWSSRYGATRERELYKNIKEQISNETAAVALVEELQKSARLYAAIQSSDHDYWTPMGGTARDNVETLLRLDLEQHRPLLLAAMQHFTPTETKKLLRALVAWSVRGLIVGGIGGGSTEKAYCDAAVRIRAGESKSVADVRADLNTIIPTDDEFKASFAVARVSRAALARYYLSALQRGAEGKLEPELIPNENEDQVNLEHILPKNSKRPDWPEFTDEDAKNYVHRLGNMALLSKGPNGRIGNKSWSEKSPVLAKSVLSLTSEVAANPSWNKKTVEDRQRAQALSAVAIWAR